jgi:hypothetical protein
MHRIWLAIRAFFLVLFHAEAARRVEQALAEAAAARAASAARPAEPPPAAKEPKRPPAPKPAARSEAITLLAALQREARFVDFVRESLAGYSDAQVGAAARDVHRGCAAVIERMFAVEPVRGEPEGTQIEVPPGFDAGQLRLTGNVAGEPPLRGRLVHPGWKATRCELPAWTGGPSAARVITPAEVEVK